MLTPILTRLKQRTLRQTQETINLIKFSALDGHISQALDLTDKHSKQFTTAQTWQLKGKIHQLAAQQEMATQCYQKAVEFDSTQPLWVKRAANRPVYDIIHLPNWGIAYFPMPKCASSSIKSLLVKIEADQDLVFAHAYYTNPFVSTTPYQPLNLGQDYCFVVILSRSNAFCLTIKKTSLKKLHCSKSLNSVVLIVI